MLDSNDDTNDLGNWRIIEEIITLKDLCIHIEEWLRVIAEPILEDSLGDLFSKSQQIRAYDLSDGNRSTREIGKLVGVDQKTISTWWRNWQKAGIVAKAGHKGQFKKLFSLADLQVLHSRRREQTDSGVK